MMPRRHLVPVLAALVIPAQLAAQTASLSIQVPAAPQSPWYTASSRPPDNVDEFTEIRLRAHGRPGDWFVPYFQVYLDMDRIGGPALRRARKLLRFHPYLTRSAANATALAGRLTPYVASTSGLSVAQALLIEPDRIRDDLAEIVGPATIWNRDIVKAYAQGIYADSQGKLDWSAQPPNWSGLVLQRNNQPPPTALWSGLSGTAVPGQSFFLGALMRHAIGVQFERHFGVAPSADATEDVFVSASRLGLTVAVQGIAVWSAGGRPVGSTQSWFESRGLDGLAPPSSPLTLPDFALTDPIEIALAAPPLSGGIYAIPNPAPSPDPRWLYAGRVGERLTVNLLLGCTYPSALTATFQTTQGPVSVDAPVFGAYTFPVVPPGVVEGSLAFMIPGTAIPAPVPFGSGAAVWFVPIAPD